ncbi:MAG: hypothetical protein WCP06_11200 [Verrucomicrobiota bacterium]
MIPSLVRFVAVFVCALALPHLGHAQAYPTTLGATNTLTHSPYYYAGRISANFGLEGYIASGTVIKAKSVITCGHILWDVDYGWGTKIYFERALYDSQRLGKYTPSSKYILSGYSSQVKAYGIDSNQAFNRDLGTLNFTIAPANGGHAGFWANPALLNGSYTTMSLGYGGEWHNGSELLKCGPTGGGKYYRIYGTAYYGNDFYVIEGGMSGGPIFAKYGTAWYVCGVNVSGDYYGMGLHAFDAAANTFIATYLY